MRWNRLRNLALLAGLCLALAACTPGPAPTPTPTALPALTGVTRPPVGQYLFVEVWMRVEGTGNLPRLMVDFPEYRFDPAAGTLAPFFATQPLSLAESDWGFVGRGGSRGGNAGGGASSRLSPIASLPYSTTVSIGTGVVSPSGLEDNRHAPVVLEAVSAEGQVLTSVDGTRLILAPGESWQRVVEADAATKEYRGHYRITSTVTNYGWQERAKVKRER